jgi:hypothetical protein
MTAKHRLLACFENVSDDITAEEAIHRIVLLSNLDRALLDADEMDHDEFVEELKSENVFESAEPQNRAN